MSFPKNVFEKNLKIAGVSEDELKKRMKIVNRMNRNGMNVGNAVVEVSKRMRDVLVREGLCMC